MHTSNTAIEAQGLRKEFDRKVAVADLTLTVNRGEVFGFLGPNGAGKTTAVKMLLGLTFPTAGSAALLGNPVGHLPTRAKIGFLPEHFRFHEWLRAGEFLELHGRLYGMPYPDRAAAIPYLLDMVGLGEQRHVKLKAFSKGMLQRIGLAQALLNSPELVFLDEPTSGLDPIGLRLVRDIINRLRQQGTTVFLNSHLLSEVEKTCDRVAFIRDGRILRSDHLEQLDQGSVRITLRVGQPTPQLLDGLKRFDRRCTLESANGTIQLSLASREQIPALAEWVIGQGHALYELTPHRLSLEERFLEILTPAADGQDSRTSLVSHD